MSSSARGWLSFVAMLIGALIAVAFAASVLQSYETRPEGHTHGSD